MAKITDRYLINMEDKMANRFGINLIHKYILKVFPEVKKELHLWAGIWKNSKEETLSRLAMDSISDKSFHALGGSVYALYPGADFTKSIEFIVSLQTISDYLDNLCDRAGVENESAFRQLHLSMLDAVDPERDTRDYYKFYPYKNDHGYLKKLVEKCRTHIKGIPSYGLVINYMKKYIHLYSDLQTYKHLSEKNREGYLKTWADYYINQYPGISWWEFSAASGSTLGIFVMFAAAFNYSLTVEQVKALDSAYFPWICGLHILLDYYIDAQEDMQMGDLNFTYYYNNLKHCEERLGFFVEKSLIECRKLKYPEFHITVLKGLLAMYLSDPKASMGLNRISTRSILDHSIPEATLYHRLCGFLRFVGVI